MVNTGDLPSRTPESELRAVIVARRFGRRRRLIYPMASGRELAGVSRLLPLPARFMILANEQELTRWKSWNGAVGSLAFCCSQQ
jgi:hypothetical protein